LDSAGPELGCTLAPDFGFVRRLHSIIWRNWTPLSGDTGLGWSRIRMHPSFRFWTCEAVYTPMSGGIGNRWMERLGSAGPELRGTSAPDFGVVRRLHSIIWRHWKPLDGEIGPGRPRIKRHPSSRFWTCEAVTLHYLETFDSAGWRDWTAVPQNLEAPEPAKSLRREAGG